MNVLPLPLAAQRASGLILLLAGFGAALAFVSGCASPERKAARARNRMPLAQRTLTATAKYFGGMLAAKATLSGSGMTGMGPGGEEGGGRRGRPSGGGMGGPPGGGMGGGMGGGGLGWPPGGDLGGPRGGDLGGPPGGGETIGGESGGAGGGGMMGLPRHVLRVAFTNEGKETLEIRVLGVKSVLGDFAARPERLALAPGQRAELDPMRSTLAPELETLELTLTVRCRKESESQVLKLTPADSTSP